MFNIALYHDIDGLFAREDVHLSDELFDEAIKGLIEKGLVEERICDDGVTRYRLTTLGIMCGEHMHSKPQDRN